MSTHKDSLLNSESIQAPSIYERIIQEGLFPVYDSNNKDNDKLEEARRIMRRLDPLLHHPAFWNLESNPPTFHLNGGASVLEEIKNTPEKKLTPIQEDLIISIMYMHGIANESRGVGNDLQTFSDRNEFKMNYTIEEVKKTKPNSEYLKAFRAMPKRYIDEILNEFKKFSE